MVTMQDVANYVGVSKASVSRVVNGLPVSYEIQTKISEAIHILGYHPNLLARALTTKRNSVIGVIVSERLTGNCVSTEILSQLLEKMCDLKKTLLVVRDNGDADSLSAGLNSLVEQHCEGIIYLSVREKEKFAHSTLMNELTEINDIPTVVIESYQVKPTLFPQYTDKQSLLITNVYSADNQIRHQYLPLNESVNQTISYFNNQ